MELYIAYICASPEVPHMIFLPKIIKNFCFFQIEKLIILALDSYFFRITKYYFEFRNAPNICAVEILMK